MKKIFLMFLLFVLFGQVIGQSKSVGYWTGTMTRDGSAMDVSLEFKVQENKLLGFFNSPSQKASGIPLDNVKTNGDSLTFELMSEPRTYFDLKTSEKSISGGFKQEGFSDGVLSLNRSNPPIKNFTQTDTSFKSGNNTIACRLYFPKGKGKFPAVVFMHGSGAEGMFANQYLAEYLASKGIITLIQDKQGVGKSSGNWMQANFEDLANDHQNAIGFLKTFPKVNSTQIGIYGHSQGASIAPLVASKSKDVAFIIAAAGVGDSIYKQDLYRVENSLKADGFTSNEVAEAMAYYAAWVDMARTGKGLEKLDELTKSAKDKKWFEWVEAPPQNHWIWKFYLPVGNYNPIGDWKSVKVPVLLVYGENDQIEDIKTYIQNINNALTSNKDVTTLILPKAQHNLCVFPEKGEKFFWWYLSRGYENMIASWVQYRFKDK